MSPIADNDIVFISGTYVTDDGTTVYVHEKGITIAALPDGARHKGFVEAWSSGGVTFGHHRLALSDTKACFEIDGYPHCIVDGLVAIQEGTDTSAEGFGVDGAADVLFKDCIAHGEHGYASDDQNGFYAYLDRDTFGYAEANFNLENCLSYGWSRAAIQVQHSDSGTESTINWNINCCGLFDSGQDNASEDGGMKAENGSDNILNAYGFNSVSAFKGGAQARDWAVDAVQSSTFDGEFDRCMDEDNSLSTEVSTEATVTNSFPQRTITENLSPGAGNWLIVNDFSSALSGVGLDYRLADSPDNDAIGAHSTLQGPNGMEIPERDIAGNWRSRTSVDVGPFAVTTIDPPEAMIIGCDHVVFSQADSTPSPQNIDVPKHCTAAYVFWEFYDAGSNHATLTLGTLNSTAYDYKHDNANSYSSEDSVHCGVCVFYDPPAGIQPLELNWSANPDSNEGPVCTVIYTHGYQQLSLTAQNVSSTVGGSGEAIDIDLVTAAGDTPIIFNGNYVNRPFYFADYNSVASSTVNNHGYRVYEAIAARAETLNFAETRNAFASLVGLSLKPITNSTRPKIIKTHPFGAGSSSSSNDLSLTLHGGGKNRAILVLWTGVSGGVADITGMAFGATNGTELLVDNIAGARGTLAAYVFNDADHPGAGAQTLTISGTGTQHWQATVYELVNCDQVLGNWSVDNTGVNSTHVDQQVNTKTITGHIGKAGLGYFTFAAASFYQGAMMPSRNMNELRWCTNEATNSWLWSCLDRYIEFSPQDFKTKMDNISGSEPISYHYGVVLIPPAATAAPELEQVNGMWIDDVGGETTAQTNKLANQGDDLTDNSSSNRRLRMLSQGTNGATIQPQVEYKKTGDPESEWEILD